MYFKKLEIFGFKSFADKTTLKFGPGITAIIGPNGCGKSNVFDAIRWVLGEQSVKELRGNSMEDVIFNGTDKKPALGFAEVSLTFSNESKILPVEFDEVTITRRLFRSGESEYLINKSTARLKDIVEMFMGTGVGAEAYSLVQQGKVDLVVSAKPEDRRVILDEASGITKYKAKRREALNKLRDTENNLLRINDIITEVKRQISSLERQANKARRYKGEFEKLKHLEVQLANHKLEVFEKQRLQMKTFLEELRTQEKHLSKELEDLNNLSTHENEMMEDLENKVNEVRSEDIKIEGQIDINNRQIGFNEERIENIELNEKRMEERKAQLIEKCRVEQEKVEELKVMLRDLDTTKAKDIETLKEKKNALDLIANSIKGSKETIKTEEEKILDITSNQVRLKNRLTESMKETQGCLARKRRLEIERNKVSAEKEEVDQRFQDISKRIQASSSYIIYLRDELSAKTLVLDDLMTRLSFLEESVDELEKKKLFLKSQKEFIEKLSVQYEDMPDPVVEGRLFTDKPPVDQTGIIGKVKKVLSVEGENYQQMVRHYQRQPSQLYEIVCETKFVELDPKQISVKIDGLNKEIAEKIVQKEDLLSKVDEQKQEVSKLELDIQEQEKIMSIFEAQRNDVTNEINKLIEELDLVKMELEEVAETLNTVKKAEDELAYQLDTLNQELEMSQMRIKERQENISKKLQEREETTVMIAQLESEIASVGDKHKSNTENLTMFLESIDNNLEAIQTIENEFIVLMDRKEQFRNDINSLRDAIVELKDQKHALHETRLNYEKQKDEVAQRINSIQNNIVSYSSEVDEIKNGVHAQEMNEQEVVFKEKEIKDRLLQAYKIELDVYNRQMVLQEQEQTEQTQEQSAEYFDPEATQIAIDRLKKRCDSFGAVNLVAIEEFEELRERFEFLTKQQSDLITSKEQLHQTINKINRQTKQMFMNTFTRVSEEFRIYFRMLFGGGEAQLTLLEPDNVLESGIEIVARPPGKKLQSISLLSGGEKTLTAIALIFGVFKVNPSPFCVLDEIDAALDESNVGRYSYLLKDFAKIAQFIVITHNKKTITSANVMYGITMQETGVSKLVSVKFGDKEDAEQVASDQSSPVEVGV